MKKIIALLLVLVSFVSLISYAVAPVVFLAVNDVFQINPSPTSMPIKISRQYYVTADTFTRVLGLKAHYNSDKQQQLIYNSDVYMIFDFTNSMVFDESNKEYNLMAVKRNGKVYVPASLVSQKFGFKYSVVTSSSLGEIVRINSDDNIPSSDVFVEKNAENMRNIYKTYNAKYNTVPDPVVPPVEPSEPEMPDVEEPDIVEPGGTTVSARRGYMTFRVGDVQGVERILTVLRQTSTDATFFVPLDMMNNGTLLRHIVAEGHNIGILIDKDITVEQLEEANALLKKHTMQKTRLVMSKNASTSLGDEKVEAIIASGFRVWDGTVKPAGNKGTTYLANAKALLRKIKKTAVISLGTGSVEAETLSSMLRFMKEERFTLYSCDVLDTPMNYIEEYR